MNKNKIKISTAIPASLSEFEIGKETNSHLTTATLKVFHKGTTADNRTITEGLANKIKETIGGTPIVARYDEETEDFIGHYYSQSVFGFVPENPEVWSEKDHYDNEWIVTKVKLFTEREDVGRIARKIIGQAQSLELNPDTLEYKLTYEEGSSTPSIELTDGDLIGLSVLGADQNPAFTGSGFFAASENKDLISEIISKYNNIPTEILVDTGGETMENFKEELERKKEEEETVITTPVVTEEDTEPETPETPEEPEILTEPEGEDGEEGGEVEGQTETTPEDTPEGDADAGEAGFEEATAEEEIGMEPQAEETPADETTFSDSERAELENYRREHKIRIVESYSDYLGEDAKQSFIDSIDSYELDSLEKEIAFESMKFVKENKRLEKDTQTTSFSFIPGQSADKDGVSDLINKYNN